MRHKSDKTRASKRCFKLKQNLESFGIGVICLTKTKQNLRTLDIIGNVYGK